MNRPTTTTTDTHSGPTGAAVPAPWAHLDTTASKATAANYGPALPTLAIDTGHPRATLAKVTDHANPLVGRWGAIIPHGGRPWAHAVPAGWLVIQLEPHADGHNGHVCVPAWACHEISTRGGHGEPLGIAINDAEKAARATAYRVPALD